MNFETLKKYKKIAVIGHKRADFDSMMSGVLLEYILKKCGTNAFFTLRDGFADASYLTEAEKLGLPTEFPAGTSDADALFLVDHTAEYDKTVAGCFDHHPKLADVGDNYLNIPRSSCAKVIYDYAIENGIEIPRDYTVGVMLSCYYDTMSFMSTKSRMSDKEWCRQIIAENCLDEKAIEKRAFGLTDTALPFDKYIRTGAKTYKTPDGALCATYAVRDGGDIDTEKAAQSLRASLTDGITEWCFILSDVADKATTVLFVTRDYHITVSKNAVLSRGKDIVPFIMNYLNAQNDGRLTAKLIAQKKHIATMESCTGGLIASTITDYEGSSAVIKGSFVTYSNEMKVKAGVSAETIEKYGVYSRETAAEMAETARNYYDSDIAVGVTGSFGNVDVNNADSVAGEIYFAVNEDKYRLSPAKLVWHNIDVTRKEMKQKTADIVIKALCALTE